MRVCLLFVFAVLILSLPAGSLCGEAGPFPYTSGSADSGTEFRAWLLVTDDPEWRQEWNDPAESVPRLKQTRTLRLGEEITVLTLYSNPRIDERGHVDITCDIGILRPDGVFSYQRESVVCGDGELSGDPANVRLAYAVISFAGEVGDPFGWWRVVVRIRDGNADVERTLETAFELVSEALMVLAK